MIDFDLIYDLLDWHQYKFAKDSLPPDSVMDNMDKKYCNLDNKKMIFEYHFFILYRYGFLEGMPPNEGIITHKGQKFYDLINIVNAINDDVLKYIKKYPLDIIYNLLEEYLIKNNKKNKYK